MNAVKSLTRTQNFRNRFASISYPSLGLTCTLLIKPIIVIANRLTSVTMFCLLTRDLPILLSVTFRDHINRQPLKGPLPPSPFPPLPSHLHSETLKECFPGTKIYLRVLLLRFSVKIFEV